MHGLEHQVEQRARLRLLDQRERLFESARSVLSIEAQLHEPFVDLALVLDERDLELLAVQATAQGFECVARDLIRRERARGVADAGQRMPEQQVRVVDENRALDARERPDRRLAAPLRLCGIVKTQADA